MPKLLTLDNTYSMHTIRARRLDQEVLYTDLNGFFEHVWRVHPAVGADPSEPIATSFGSPTVIPVNNRHSVVEGRVGRSARLRSWPRLNFLLAQVELIGRLSALIRREEISVIRAGDPYYLAVLGLLLSHLNRIPLVVRVDANYDLIYRNVGEIAYPRLLRRRSIEKRIERFVFSRAELVVGGNQNNLDYALSNGADPNRAALFRVGTMIDPRHHVDPGERRPVAAELGLADRPFLAYVGRLEPLKYCEDVVQVLARCRECEPNLAAVLAGDGSSRSQLEALASELGVLEHVVFAGYRDQMWLADMLASATIVVAPDGGRSLIEAALAGTPVVAYAHEWHSELLSSGTSGLLVPFRDVDAMSAAVCELLRDPDEATVMGRRGREAALEMMDPARLIEIERQHYEKLLAGRPPQRGVTSKTPNATRGSRASTR